MADPLVLDTSAMRDRDFRYWLSGYHGEKLLPIIAYTELSIYLVGAKHKTQAYVDSMLRSMGVEVEWYRQTDARMAVEWAVAFGESENLRDYMIASRAVIAPWTVVTNNTKHFSFLGDRVRTPQEVMRRF